MKRNYGLVAGSVILAAYATVAMAGSSFVGSLLLVEQYAPGLSATSGPTCYVAVSAPLVSTKAACASVSGKYYYAWNCEDPKRKSFLGMALAAYAAGHKVQLLGSGQCDPHPSYEGLDYFVISETP